MIQCAKCNALIDVPSSFYGTVRCNGCGRQINITYWDVYGVGIVTLFVIVVIVIGVQIYGSSQKANSSPASIEKHDEVAMKPEGMPQRVWDITIDKFRQAGMSEREARKAAVLAWQQSNAPKYK